MTTNCNDNKSWATADEIRFFQRSQIKGLSKLEFLQNYKEGIRHRKIWGSINKNKLMQALNKEITKEKGEV